MGLNGRVIRKIHFTQFFRYIYVPNLLQTCTIHKKPLGFSKNLALDERPFTKAFQKM